MGKGELVLDGHTKLTFATLDNVRDKQALSVLMYLREEWLKLTAYVLICRPYSIIQHNPRQGGGVK